VCICRRYFPDELGNIFRAHLRQPQAWETVVYLLDFASVFRILPDEKGIITQVFLSPPTCLLHVIASLPTLQNLLSLRSLRAFDFPWESTEKCKPWNFRK